MSDVDQLKSLLDQGDYLKAAHLADKLRLTDYFGYLKEVADIAESIEHSISSLSLLEDNIGSYQSELCNVRDTAFKIEEKEHAVQLECKNISNTCDLIQELIENLTIPDHIQKVILDSDLDDERSVRETAAALEQFKKHIGYQPSQTLERMKCVRDLKELAYNLKVKFSRKFYQYFTDYIDYYLPEFAESLINNIFNQTASVPRHEILHNHMLCLSPLVHWTLENDAPICHAMFEMVETRFADLVDHYNNQNGIFSLYLLIGLSEYRRALDNTQTFLKQVYSDALIRVKRNFDNFMQQQVKAMSELKAPKQLKCGVLSAVKNFEQLAKQVEPLFKNSDDRRYIDRWYLEFVEELFRTIERVEHSRTPVEIIRLENYKYLDNVLRSLKVPCLKACQEDANKRYKKALDDYVKRYFGRPLEKLNIFFEGVDAKIAQGVKEEEISFQSAFSKQEIRKVLQMVTLKEVRKGLEEMYKRIEKHVSEPESNLIQVIWRAMQEEFLLQYKKIQDMIYRCYPSSNLSLTFNFDDVLQVFQDIAQLH